MSVSKARESAFDPIVLGHNQFFGVDHLSSAKGAERERKFSDMRNIVGLIDFAMSEGVNGLMLSTHPRAKEICDELRGMPGMKKDLSLYPVLPYIAKYVREANEKGLTNVVLDSLKNAPITQKLGTLFKGGTGLLSGDVFKMLETLIDFELLIFKGLRVRAVFLHQALTDLVLGLDMKEVAIFYNDYIRKSFGAEPAYCTFNLPFLVKRFREWGIENPIVMASFNAAGFSMNPDLSSNEECLRNEKVRLFAMGTMASGYLHPRDAFEYLGGFPNIASVVVGVSREAHARETFGLIRKSMR